MRLNGNKDKEQWLTVSDYEYIYGINPAFEVLRAKRRRVSQALISRRSESNPKVHKLVSLLDRAKVPVERTATSRLAELCQSTEHQGVVLKVESYPYVPFESLIENSRFLLLDNVEDPHNVGAILRSADIFGWHSVLISSKGVPEIYPSVVKVSAGATEHLRISMDRSANEYVKLLMERGYTVVALDKDGRETLHHIQTLSIKKLLLVIGGEHFSVGQYILNIAHHVVSIPQHGNVQSLNASVAAGIAMFALSEIKL